MTTTIKIKTITIKAILLFLIMNLAFACSNEKTNTPKADVTPTIAAAPAKPAESITITGTVKKMTSGKDGYSAEVQTDADGVYAALVSIVNMSGPDKYKSCVVGDKVSFKGVPSVMGDAKQLRVEEIISIGTSSTDTQLLITSTGFRGIQVGDAISKHGAYTKKTKMKTGEGSFDVYEIKDFENNPAGYFMPDSKNKLLVGDITVESPKASTDKGLKIGSTFKDLLKAYPNVEVHGSEIESRTYATADKLRYRLDVANNTYDVDKAKIPAATKITEIVINRAAAGTQSSNLAAQYSKITPDEFCWQATKVLNLRTKPSADSKIEGKHFQGEVLSVLGTKMVNNQLWVNVKYNFKIKAGYEDKFADGQVSPSGGETTGWIGGAETPKISCK
jgi:hypothetical protein